jgi:hypothetical protein
MKKFVYFAVIFSIIFTSFVFSETDYFISETEGGGIFMKWDKDWYEGDYLSDSGINSLFGVLYALVTNQYINGNRYIIIAEDNIRENYNYSFIKVSTNPEYIIYFYSFNNGEIKNYIISFRKEIEKTNDYLLIEKISIADKCSAIAWAVVKGRL